MKTLTLSILQFNTFVKNILDAEQFLAGIGVFGEVTNYKVSGGNAYFDLKDENAMLSCVKFGASDLTIKNGDKIIAFGKVNFYVKSGRLNFIVSKTQAYGMGDLYQKFLELKNKLESEGYFKEEIKKPIPRFSKKIGVVTSETGAVIRDIINVTRKKNPFTDIVVYPSKVQGVNAEEELASGIRYFNTRDDIDVIIVARGGGSLEDLSPFNTEVIVKAIYESKLPVISAVGHETDFTLCDFASDLRVPTPSVGAEVAVFDYYEQVKNIEEIEKRILLLLQAKLKSSKEALFANLDGSAKSLKLKHAEYKSKFLKLQNEISGDVSLKLQTEKSKLEKLIDVLEKLNPIQVLKNGYAIIEKDGKKLTSTKLVELNDVIAVALSDGKFEAIVTHKED